MTTEVMISGVRSLVSDPQKAPLTQEEQETLGAALYQPAGDSGVMCQKCACNLPLFSLLGNLIAVEVQQEWNKQRAKMGIVVSWTKRGQVSSVEWPSGYSTCRIFSGVEEGVLVDTTTNDISDDCRSWMSREKPTRGSMLFPDEGYLSSLQMFSDRVLSLSAEAAVSVLREKIRCLKNDTMGREYERFGSEDDTGKLRRVSVRKSLSSRVTDTYSQGLPEQGWYFESIASWTEFA